MNPQKSSKKLSIVVAVFVLVLGIFIGGYLVLKSGRGSASQLAEILKGESFSAALCAPDQNDPNKDSDNDGLKDWEELQLYGTDACKQDTDGDGYYDGEEVAAGYDPAKKAPGDELPGTTPKGPRPLPNNLTKALTASLVQQISVGKIPSFSTTGEFLSSDELQEYPALQQSVKEMLAAGQNLFAPESIDKRQIKIISDNSRAAIQAYATTAYNFFPKNQADQISELDLIINAIQGKDIPNDDIEKQLKIYQDAYNKFLTLTVPSEFLPLHKKQLEIFSSLIKIHQSIKSFSSDPLLASLALNAYQNVLTDTLAWRQGLADFIKTHP